MEIRDPVHGSIHILDEEIPVIQDDFFGRLRGIKQLGFSEFIFPGATHSRFIHSLGVMWIGSKAFDSLMTERLERKDFHRLKQTFKMACLLHDIGHAPLSHSTESVMPYLRDLNIPKQFLLKTDTLDRQATHEDYTIKAIADSSFADSFTLLEKKFKVERKCIAELIVGKTENVDYFTVGGVNYFPLLHQLVSSEMDCDRMDYLLRDSYFCGVSYGHYDLDWLIDNLEVCIDQDKAYLGISERAVITFDDFLLSRYHMFVMVYFHYRSVCLEQLLMRYFKTSQDGYRIPCDIESYIEHDDHYLMKILRKSDNVYAQRIVKNNIPTKIFESFNEDQAKTLDHIEKYLIQQKIEYIKSSSQGRLSKYYRPDKPVASFPIKVIKKLFQEKKTAFFDIDQATDLFEKYSKAHAISRLHVDFEDLSKAQKKDLQELVHK